MDNIWVKEEDEEVTVGEVGGDDPMGMSSFTADSSGFDDDSKANMDRLKEELEESLNNQEERDTSWEQSSSSRPKEKKKERSKKEIEEEEREKMQSHHQNIMSEENPPREEHAKKRNRLMRFTPEIDALMIRHVLAINPYEDGTRWQRVLEAMLIATGKPLTIKNMQARINLLITQFITKDDQQISGQEPRPPSEQETLLEQVVTLKVSSKKARSGRTSKRGMAVFDASERDSAALLHWMMMRNQTMDSQAIQPVDQQEEPSSGGVHLLDDGASRPLSDQEVNAVGEEENLHSDWESSQDMVDEGDGAAVGVTQLPSHVQEKPNELSDSAYVEIVDLTQIQQKVLSPTSLPTTTPKVGFITTAAASAALKPHRIISGPARVCAVVPARRAIATPPGPDQPRLITPHASSPVERQPNDAGGPVRRKRALLIRSLEYMKENRVIRNDLKKQELELALLREQNESRRIAIQEQRIALEKRKMDAVMSCFKIFTDLLKQVKRDT